MKLNNTELHAQKLVRARNAALSLRFAREQGDYVRVVTSWVKLVYRLKVDERFTPGDIRKVLRHSHPLC